MREAWKKLDLGGGGLQSANLRLAALLKMSDAREGCRDGETLCSTQALRLQDEAGPLATTSTVAIVLGSAAVTTGLVLALAPIGQDGGARVSIGPGHVTARFTW